MFHIKSYFKNRNLFIVGLHSGLLGTLSMIFLDLTNHANHSGVLLKCKVHHCPSSCHQVFDHSKMLCRAIVELKCPNGHTNKSQCHEGLPSTTCSKCEKERKEAIEQARKDLDDQMRRDDMIRKHQKEVEKVQKEIDKIQHEIQDALLKSEQDAVMAQKKKDLSALQERLNQTRSAPLQDPSATPAQNSPSFPKNVPQRTAITTPQPPQEIPKSNVPDKKDNIQKHLQACLDHNSSPSNTEWQRQKDQENAKNPAIEKIMEMIGLEDVKSQVLRIKSKVDLSKRQGTDLRKERFGLVLLGNPGTGMYLFSSLKYFFKVQNVLGPWTLCNSLSSFDILDAFNTPMDLTV